MNNSTHFEFYSINSKFAPNFTAVCSTAKTTLKIPCHGIKNYSPAQKMDIFVLDFWGILKVSF
jgi:hypothetical protein